MVAPPSDDQTPRDGYSSTVKLLLHTRNTTLELWDLGPDDATLRSPSTLTEPDDDAWLEIIVDGRSESHPVSVTASDQHNRIAFR